jgi:SNF2 family DNA or RNA helicase
MDYKFKTKPYQHQKDALEKSWNRDSFAYFMEMGTGKTKVLIDNLALLYEKNKVDGALIIAPKGVVGTWFNQELPTHLPKRVKNVTVLWQSNINKKQKEKLNFEQEGLHILIMNVEAFSTQKGFSYAEKFLTSHKSMMAIDESTTIKNPRAKRTKNILLLSKAAKYRRIMTGSPVTRNPLDLYSQCEFLDPKHLDFPSYYAFRNRYAEMKTMFLSGRSVQVVGGFRHLEELSESLKAFSYRILKENCLDLPNKIYMEREIQLTSEQERLYEQMRQEALATLNGKTVTTMTALTQLMRLHQITCGHFAADDGSIQEVKNNRLAELLDVLDEIEGKAIIWAHYQHDVKNIFKLLEDKYGPGSVVHYYGKTLPEQRDYAIKNFKENDRVRFFVGTPQTGGYGITLVQASTVIYYSNGYDLEKRMQSEDRAHRIGQKKKVTYIDFIAPNTIDEKIRKALRKKINIASKVMGEELKKWI